MTLGTKPISIVIRNKTYDSFGIYFTDVKITYELFSDTLDTPLTEELKILELREPYVNESIYNYSQLSSTSAFFSRTIKITKISGEVHYE